MKDIAHAIELPDLPPPEPNCSTARVVVLDGSTFVIYEANPFVGDHERGWVLVRFVRCALVMTGGPNDEGLPQYRPGGAALMHYTNQEVIDSPLIATGTAIAVRPGFPPPLRRAFRHFIFAFKEEIFQCLAVNYQNLGTYETFCQAYEAAREKGCGSPRA